MIKVLLIICGTISVVLGVVGIFVPLLPTTPFLLLAAMCYARSSEFFHNWLINNRLFGIYIKNYRAGRGIPLREKILAIVALWLTIGFTAAFVVLVWWWRIVLIAIAVGVTIHLVWIRTFKTDPNILH